MRILNLLVITLFITSCTFRDNSEAFQSTLGGSWLMFERGFSPGAGYIVEAVAADPPKSMTFGEDGSFNSNIDGYNMYQRFRTEQDQQQDVLVLAASSDTFDDPNKSARFTIEFKDGAMFLYRRWCIEGCHEAFRKIGSDQDQNP